MATIVTHSEKQFNFDQDLPLGFEFKLRQATDSECSYC